MATRIPNVHVRSTIPDEIRERFHLPPELETPQAFIDKCLTDSLFFVTFVMRHGKKKEYRDLNRIHAQLLRFLDPILNPIAQKLALMCRDSLKSTVGRGFFIQQFLKLSVSGVEGLLGLVTGQADLSAEHLQIIEHEILTNQIIQAFFAGYVPRSEKDAESWNDEKIRWGKMGVDIGSMKKTLSGRHYLGIWNDNLMNEVNARTYDGRQAVVNLWRAQEPLLTDEAWELVTETPWEADDISGHILDPENLNFDYAALRGKSPAIFVADSGYAVFSCFARNERGELNFPEKLTEKYLQRKLVKQGFYLYSRMYDGQIVSSEERLFSRPDIIYYETLPENTFRNIAVDCSGTTGRESTPTGVVVGDWDEEATLNVPSAEKRKLDPMGVFRWVTKIWDESVEQGRRPLWLLIEHEKYGIFLKSLLENERPDIRVRLVHLRGVPQPDRIHSLKPEFQRGKIRLRRGLRDLEVEILGFRRGRAKEKQIEAALLDCLYLHMDSKYVPKKRPVFTPAQVVEDAFKKQIDRDLAAAGRTPVREFVEGHF